MIEPIHTGSMRQKKYSLIQCRMISRCISTGFILLAVMMLPSGCTPLLERSYATSEPHSSKFWESEAAGTLRAENYQDIVNDLLLLVSQHRETASLRLYNYVGDMAVNESLERAALEVQQETPMGAYAVEYITASSRALRGYYEISVQISYRRTEEQIRSVIHATSAGAFYHLLDRALQDGQTELAVRVGFWNEDSPAQTENAVARLREELGLLDGISWPTIIYYPQGAQVGLVEFLLDIPPEAFPETENPPEDIPDSDSSSNTDIYSDTDASDAFSDLPDIFAPDIFPDSAELSAPGA